MHENDRACGAPRATAELNDDTPVGGPGRVDHKRVARVMRGRGSAGLRLRRKVRTRIVEPNYPDMLEMAADVDTMAVLVPDDPQTNHLVDAGVLRALRPGGVLVNVGRRPHG